MTGNHKLSHPLSFTQKATVTVIGVERSRTMASPENTLRVTIQRGVCVSTREHMKYAYEKSLNQTAADIFKFNTLT